MHEWPGDWVNFIGNVSLTKITWIAIETKLPDVYLCTVVTGHYMLLFKKFLNTLGKCNPEKCVSTIISNLFVSKHFSSQSLIF